MSADSELARRHSRAALFVVGALLAAVAFKRARAWLAPRPSVDECVRLVDRYLEQGERQRRPEARAEELAAAIAQAHASDNHRRDVADCRQTLSKRQVECGLSAANVDQLERCVQ